MLFQTAVPLNIQIGSIHYEPIKRFSNITYKTCSVHRTVQEMKKKKKKVFFAKMTEQRIFQWKLIFAFYFSIIQDGSCNLGILWGHEEEAAVNLLYCINTRSNLKVTLNQFDNFNHISQQGSNVPVSIIFQQLYL